MAKQIYKYLLKNDYTNEADDSIAPSFHQAKANGLLAPMPVELEPYREQILNLIDGVYSEAQLPGVGDDRKLSCYILTILLLNTKSVYLI